MLRNKLAHLWTNWCYRWIPARISDRVDNHEMMNLKTFRGLVKEIGKLEKRIEVLEKQNAKN